MGFILSNRTFDIVISVLLMCLFVGCQRSINERIIDAAVAIEENRLNEITEKQILLTSKYPKVVYVRSIELFGINLHYFNIYQDLRAPAHPKTLIVMKLPNKKMTLVRNTSESIKYMKPFGKYELQVYGLDYYAAKSNWLFTQIIEFNELMGIDSTGRRESEAIINSIEDLPNLNDNDKKRLISIGFNPVKKTLFTDRIEVLYYTWNYRKAELSENKLSLSEKVTWQRRIILREFGPPNPYPMYR